MYPESQQIVSDSLCDTYAFFELIAYISNNSQIINSKYKHVAIDNIWSS